VAEWNLWDSLGDTSFFDSWEDEEEDDDYQSWSSGGSGSGSLFGSDYGSDLFDSGPSRSTRSDSYADFDFTPPSFSYSDDDDEDFSASLRSLGNDGGLFSSLLNFDSSLDFEPTPAGELTFEDPPLGDMAVPEFQPGELPENVEAAALQASMDMLGEQRPASELTFDEHGLAAGLAGGLDFQPIQEPEIQALEAREYVAPDGTNMIEWLGSDGQWRDMTSAEWFGGAPAESSQNDQVKLMAFGATSQETVLAQAAQVPADLVTISADEYTAADGTNMIRYVTSDGMTREMTSAEWFAAPPVESLRQPLIAETDQGTTFFQTGPNGETYIDYENGLTSVLTVDPLTGAETEQMLTYQLDGHTYLLAASGFGDPMGVYTDEGGQQMAQFRDENGQLVAVPVQQLPQALEFGSFANLVGVDPAALAAVHRDPTTGEMVGPDVLVAQNRAMGEMGMYGYVAPERPEMVQPGAFATSQEALEGAMGIQTKVSENEGLIAQREAQLEQIAMEQANAGRDLEVNGPAPATEVKQRADILKGQDAQLALLRQDKSKWELAGKATAARHAELLKTESPKEGEEPKPSLGTSVAKGTTEDGGILVDAAGNTIRFQKPEPVWVQLPSQDGERWTSRKGFYDADTGNVIVNGPMVGNERTFEILDPETPGMVVKGKGNTVVFGNEGGPIAERELREKRELLDIQKANFQSQIDDRLTSQQIQRERMAQELANSRAGQRLQEERLDHEIANARASLALQRQRMQQEDRLGWERLSQDAEQFAETIVERQADRAENHEQFIQNLDLRRQEVENRVEQDEKQYALAMQRNERELMADLFKRVEFERTMAQRLAEFQLQYQRELRGRRDRKIIQVGPGTVLEEDPSTGEYRARSVGGGTAGGARSRGMGL
jgi:hypothetical protein